MIGGYAATNAANQPGLSDPEQWPTILTHSQGTATRLLHMESISDARIEGLEFREGRVTESPLAGGALRAINVTNLFVDGCRFLGNRIDHAGGSAYGGGIYAVGSGTIKNTVLSGNQSIGTAWNARSYGGGAWLSGDWNVSSVVVSHNHLQNDRYESLGGGLYLADGTYRLHNLLVVYNASINVGKEMRSVSRGAGIYADSDTSLVVSNLTMAFNYYSGQDIPLSEGIEGSIGLYHAGTAEIHNSILYGHDPSDVRTDSPPTLSHCLVGDGSGDVTGDPLFEAPLFYLATNSPAVDAGGCDVASAGLDGLTTFTNGTTDTGPVNLGYHYEHGTAPADKLYVSETGDDNDSGTCWETALRSVTRALEIALPRTRIHVGAGHYTNGIETFPLRNHGRLVQLVGAGKEATILDASSSGKRVIEIEDALLQGAILSGMTVTGGFHTRRGGGIYVNRSAITLTDVRLTGNSVWENERDMRGGGLGAEKSAGVMRQCVLTQNTCGEAGASWRTRSYGGGAWLQGGNWEIIDCEISHNQALGTSHDNGMWSTGGGGLFFDQGTALRLLLRNTLVIGNAVDGRQDLGAGLYARASVQDRSARVMLENCTVAGNLPEGLRGSSDMTVTNSILWNNGVDSTGTVTIAWSIIENSSDYTDGGNNLSTDPLFVDAAGGNYRLQRGSPAIDTGSNQPWMVGATDLDGLPRVMKGTVDRGCYEEIPPAGSLFFIR